MLSDRDVRTYFRGLFKSARLAAQRDAEDFDHILFAIERLGFFLADGHDPKQHGLGKYREPLLTYLAAVPDEGTDFRISHRRLYELVERGRNDAFHLGAAARHLVSHAIELALRIEEALSMNDVQVRDFMVVNPVCAELWQPLQFVRKLMLENSFSYLPVKTNVGWRLISDFSLATYLGRTAFRARQERMKQTLGEAQKLLISAKRAEPSTAVGELEFKDERPVLVFEPDADDRPIGIITAFDIL